MRELAGEDVGEDFEVAVRVRGEAGGGRDAVFVQDAQGAEVLVGGVVVLGEGEGVVAVEPAVVGVYAGFGVSMASSRQEWSRKAVLGTCLVTPFGFSIGRIGFSSGIYVRPRAEEGRRVIFACGSLDMIFVAVLAAADMRGFRG